MKNKNTWIDKLHKTQVKILDEVDRICQKNNIQYFMTGGTLIGAVRHKGFIPWDDDIDLGMPRKDYKKFIKCCKKDLSSKYILDFFPVNKKSYHLFGKVRIKGTELVESDIKDCKLNHEIWIDIFPYDNIKKEYTKLHYFKNNFRKNMQKIINLKVGINSTLSEYRKKHKVIMTAIDLFVKIIPLKVLMGITNMIISLNKNEKSKYLSCMVGGLALEKETHLKSEVFPTVKLEFEGKKYPCPKEYDKILTRIYGDYMKLPPVEKRQTHNPTKIKFEDGETIEFGKEQ